MKPTYDFDALPERIAEKICPEPNTGCWLWTAAKSSTGYGHFSLRGKKKVAHRAIYEFLVGAIPDAMCACHKCDTPVCVNPGHIFIGTHKENAADRNRKGRHYVTFGELNPKAKLTKEQVLQIRDMAANNSLASLAKLFGVAPQTISRIVLRQAWRCLTESPVQP